MAVNFEDLKEQISTSLKHSWEQFQETALYNQVKDRYENLSPTGQKLSIVAVLFFVFLIVFSFPWGFYSKSSEFVGEYESKRSLIRDLLKVSRESNSGPNIPAPPPLDAVRTRIEGLMQQSQFTPEQVRGVELLSEKSQMIPADLTEGVFKVSLTKLNLRQVIDFGFQLQSLSQSIKVKDLILNTNAQDPRYLDVTYKLLTLKVPEFQPNLPEVEEPPTRKKRKTGDEE